MALGIIGDAFIAEIDAVFQYPHALPVLSVIAVVKTAGQLFHHHFQIDRGLFHLRNLCHQFFAVIPIDHQLDLTPSFIAQSAANIGGRTVIAGQARLFPVMIRVIFQPGLRSVGQFLFPAKQSVLGTDLIKLSVSGPDTEISRPLRQRPGAIVRVSYKLPLQIQPGFIEIVKQISLKYTLRQIRGRLLQAGAPAPVDGQPAVFGPLHRIQRRLPSHCGIMSLIGPAAEIVTPPLSVLILHQLAMAAALDGGLGIRLPHHRVVGRILIGAVHIFAAGHIDAVPIACAPLRHHGVIIAVLFQQMRPFGAALPRAVPGRPHLPGHLQTVPAQGHGLRRLGNDHVPAAVLLHKMGGVNIVHFQADGLAVGPFWPVGHHHQLPAHHIVVPLAIRIEPQRGKDIEPALHIGDIRRPDPVGIPDIADVQPLRVADGMAHDMPVHHIPGMGYGNGREILKTGVYHIVVIPYPDHGRIREKAPLHRVVIHSLFAHRSPPVIVPQHAVLVPHFPLFPLFTLRCCTASIHREVPSPP